MINITAGIIFWTVAFTSPGIEPLETSTLSTDKKIYISDKSDETTRRTNYLKDSQENKNEDPGKPEKDFQIFTQNPALAPSFCSFKGFLYKKIDLTDNSQAQTKNDNDLNWDDISINNVPFWIRSRLFLTLNTMEQTAGLNLISKLIKISEIQENIKYLDELFFVIAFSSPVELEHADFSPEMILQSVKTLYASSKDLDYAELIEKGTEETGELTTVSLNVKNGSEITATELDPWLYYAFIVHPRLDGEVLGSFDPSENTFMDIEKGGTDFRTNFFYGDPVSKSYSGHYIFRNDWTVEADKFVMPDGKHQCYVTFSENESDHLNLIESSNGPCMTETFTGSGNILGVGLDMKSINNKTALSNLINYGNGYCSLKGKTILVYDEDESADFLKKGIEYNLSDYEYVKVTDLSNDTLFTTVEENDSLSYSLNAGKIIVSSEMSDAAYSKISEMKEAFDIFAAQGGSVLMFLYSADSDPCSYDLPGNMKCKKNSNVTENFNLAGHPVLKDHLSGTDFFYETGVEPYFLTGEIPLNKNACAIEKTGDWVGLNMQRNISEMNNTSEKVERAVQAVRVAYNHYGNCGENQDISGAAMKTALIPVINVNNSAEDHVWNEIWTPDGWLPMQSAWSNYSQDYGTVGKICMEKKFDGGKDISYVYAWRGDHLFFNRTATYSDTVITQLSVVDSEGKGVPDAAVLIATESYYDNSQLTIAGATSTDINGKATLMTGDNRNIYIQIISESLGVFPGLQKVEKIVLSENATPGSEFEYTAKLNMKLPEPLTTSITEEPVAGEQDITIDLTASQFLSHTNPFNEGVVFKAVDLSGNVHIFNEEQFVIFKENGTAKSIRSVNVMDLPITLSVPKATYYAVFATDVNATTVGEFKINSDVGQDDEDADEEDNDSDKKSDGCSVITI